MTAPLYGRQRPGTSSSAANPEGTARIALGEGEKLCERKRRSDNAVGKRSGGGGTRFIAFDMGFYFCFGSEIRFIIYFQVPFETQSQNL